MQRNAHVARMSAEIPLSIDNGALLYLQPSHWSWLDIRLNDILLNKTALGSVFVDCQKKQANKGRNKADPVCPVIIKKSWRFKPQKGRLASGKRYG